MEPSQRGESFHIVCIMSIFSKFKRAKQVADKDEVQSKVKEKRSYAVQAYDKPLPPLPIHVCTCADQNAFIATQITPVFPRPPRSPADPIRFSSEEARIRIAAVKKRKSEMSLRATSPPKRIFAASRKKSVESLDPPPRPLLRVRSDMSMRVSVPKEPGRPNTSSGHSTTGRTRTQYKDNYSFYADNPQPLREFGPMLNSRSTSAPQVPRPKTTDDSSSRKSPYNLSLKRPSLLNLTMEEEPERCSSSSRYSQETSPTSENTAVAIQTKIIRRFSKMRSLPTLRLKPRPLHPPPPALITEISAPYRPSDLTVTTDMSSINKTKPLLRSPKSPRSPIPTWRYEDFLAAPPPVLETPASPALSSSIRSGSRRASISSLFYRRNGSVVFAT
ncbi:hypothetical protein DM02DRAFT_689037 [Periconia macrospinosa]|uniref:Uncharacterized protein n=1 Tax=Periconia macrospinosa TaxID=97972 RepID=A0A2V1E3J6_9PLEO|nr:hypothetical protein DM02DRAFT_689037 [Periconia macrospinosa]